VTCSFLFALILLLLTGHRIAMDSTFLADKGTLRDLPARGGHPAKTT